MKKRRKHKKQERGMLITHCHTGTHKKHSIRVVPGDAIEVCDDLAFPVIHLRRGDKLIHLGAFLNRTLRNQALFELRMARAAGESRIRMPSAGVTCPCCDRNDATSLRPRHIVKKI